MEGVVEVRPHLQSQLHALALALQAVSGSRVLLESGRQGSNTESIMGRNTADTAARRCSCEPGE